MRIPSLFFCLALFSACSPSKEPAKAPITYADCNSPACTCENNCQCSDKCPCKCAPDSAE
ncbi:MAG: hypothetical protein HYZ48_00900 [Chlamydiales bacterium]|nr:hypothetical protein [Chlamydiales bacterium]